MKILFNIATHGDEKIGLRVAKKIQKLNIDTKKLVINIANEKALKLNRRFIDQDLNRSFPGSARGNHEQRLAHRLLPIVKSAGIVIDIHSTTSDLKDSLIVTKLNKATCIYTEAIGPKYVLLMNATKSNALISSAKIGIAFEYGSDADPKAIAKTELGIKRLLASTGLINKSDFVDTIKKTKPKYFNVYRTVTKPRNAILGKNIRNLMLVKKGQRYAMVGTKHLLAEEDFYPVLFGERKYKNIFGFAAKKIDLK